MPVERVDQKSSTHYREQDPAVRQALGLPSIGPEGSEIYRVGRCRKCGVELLDKKPEPRDLCSDRRRCADVKKSAKKIDEWMGKRR